MHTPLLQLPIPVKFMFSGSVLGKELCIKCEIFGLAGTLFTLVKLCGTGGDKVRGDKREMTYKHLYHFHISLVNVHHARLNDNDDDL